MSKNTSNMIKGIAVLLLLFLHLFNNIGVYPMVFLFNALQIGGIVGKALAFLGRYSLPIWLTHAYFYQYYFSSFIYSFRYAAVIYIVLLILSIAVSVPIDKLSTGIYHRFIRLE